MKNTRDAQRRLLNVQEAADYLSVKERFIRRIIAERRVEFVRVGRHIRFDQKVLDAFIDDQTVRAVR